MIHSTHDDIRDARLPGGGNIDLSAIACTCDSGGAFTGTAGEVIVIGRAVRVDKDGDVIADMFISLPGRIALTGSDFILA